MANEDVIVGESDNYPNSEVEQLKTSSLSNFIFNQLNIHGQKIIQIDGVSGKSETFEELSRKAKALAGSLLQLVAPGDVIAVSCENRLEYGAVLLASVCAGTVFAPINPSYSPDEIVHVLNISKPRLVFCSAYTLKNIATSLPRLPSVSQVILFDEVPSKNIPNLIQYGTLLRNQPVGSVRQSRDSDIAVILTSSGTTGLPKGVMLSYGNLKYFCSFSMGRRFLNLRPVDVILGLLPLYHGYGYGILLVCLVIGIKFIVLPKFEERLFLSTIEKFKITNLYLVPPLMVFLAKHPLVSQYDLSSVRDVVCGAASLSSEVTTEVQRRLPAADIRQGYGMTEASVVITISPPRCNKPESVGKLATQLQAKVVDVESGVPVGRGQQGEIVVRGPCVMSGYCNDLEATRQTVDARGWLHTGDVGYVDHQGFFYVVDRIKELIKYKGFQVAPAELESILLGMSGVKDAAVVGLPDLVAGELPIAYIVLAPKATLTKTDIMNHVNGQVSPQKRLRDVRFIEAIPRNPSGKVLRRILRDALKSKL